MEVCGGHTHTIYRHGIEHVLPPSASSWCTAPAARCASSRWAASTTPSRVAETPGVIFTSFGDMMRVPGGNGNLLEAKAARRRRPLRVLAARRAAHRGRRRPTATSCSSPSGSRRPRRRPRSRCSRPASAASPTSACSATTSRSSRRSRRSSSRPTCASTASSAPATCRRSSGNRPVPVRARAVRQAARHRRVRAARHPPGDRDAARPRSARAGARSRTSTPGSCATRATRVRWRCSPRCSSCGRTSSGAASGFISQSALEAAARVRRLRRRAALRGAGRAGRRPEGVPVRRGAEGRHQAVGVQGVRHRVHARRRRSARAWCRRRARAPRTTTSAACTARPRSRSEGLDSGKVALTNMAGCRPGATRSPWRRCCPARSASALQGPAPTDQEIDAILQAAVTVPDHGGLRPWRLCRDRRRRPRRLRGRASPAPPSSSSRTCSGATPTENSVEAVRRARTHHRGRARGSGGHGFPDGSRSLRRPASGTRSRSPPILNCGLGAMWKSIPFVTGTLLRTVLDMGT